MIELHNAHYQMDLGCGGDVWTLFGTVVNHPNFTDGSSIHVSTPVAFNLDTDELTTSSGRNYKIISYQNREKVIKQIQNDIAAGGYEVH